MPIFGYRCFNLSVAVRFPFTAVRILKEREWSRLGKSRNKLSYLNLELEYVYSHIGSR